MDENNTDPYLMVDPQVAIPDPRTAPSDHPLRIVNYFEPDETVRFFDFGTKNQERLIFSIEDDYTDYEYQKVRLQFRIFDIFKLKFPTE